MRLTVVILILISFTTSAQDSLRIRRLQFRGYIKDIQSMNFQSNLSDLVTGNLIHNRLNFKWNASDRFTAALEFRNRLFWGEEVKFTPGFSSRLRNSNEALDLSANWVDNENIVLNSTIDRMWFEYSADKWNIRVGRQRINWGIGTTWNPNDLFNTYNFLDFDYEERPGADAIKVQYYTGVMSHVELALSVTDSSKNMIMAGKYFMNIAAYDFQFVTGWFHEQPTVGIGWSGSIKESGFKGEVQYFLKRMELRDQINISVEADHVFESGWYINAGAFLNSVGIEKTYTLSDISSMNLSPQNLMPTKWNTLFMVSKEITPLFTVSSTIIYAPGTNLVIFLPNVAYNLTQDLDVNLVWQSFFGDTPTGFDDITHRAFIRIKLSF